MSLVSILLYSIVTLWLVITLLAQHTRFRPFSSIDAFHVIPRWTFFAPNPGIRDYHLVIRDRCRDGRTSGWKSVPIYSARPRFGYLWHPQKRSSKIMNDAIQSIKLLLKRENVGATGLPFTMPYLLLYIALLTPCRQNRMPLNFRLPLSSPRDMTSGGWNVRFYQAFIADDIEGLDGHYIMPRHNQNLISCVVVAFRGRMAFQPSSLPR